MKYWIVVILTLVIFSSCSLNDINSSAQTVDMGKFPGLRIIQIASVNYPESIAVANSSRFFSDKDRDNFSDSLIQSLKRSDVRVLPSAQTKIHIDFINLATQKDSTGSPMTLAANVIVSRNGIITRKTIEISSKAKRNVGATKSNSVKMFIQELGNLLREQSSFKR